jgi:hypothetical protein
MRFFPEQTKCHQPVGSGIILLGNRTRDCYAGSPNPTRQGLDQRRSAGFRRNRIVRSWREVSSCLQPVGQALPREPQRIEP